MEGLKRYDPFRASPPWTVARNNDPEKGFGLPFVGWVQNICDKVRSSR